MRDVASRLAGIDHWVVRGLLLHLQLLRLLLRESCCWLLLLYGDCRRPMSCCCLCCRGLALLGLDDAVVHHTHGSFGFFHEGEDHDGHNRIVDNIPDGNPVLVAIKCNFLRKTGMFRNKTKLHHLPQLGPNDSQRRHRGTGRSR